MNYVVANRIFVKPDYCDEFERRFRQRAGQIDKQLGFVRMEILQPDSDETPYTVLTHWDNKAAFDNWVGSDDFKVAHQNPMSKDAFSDGGGIEMYNVIITASADS